MIDFFRKITPRGIFTIVFLASSGALTAAYYAQFVNNADPCPLCIAQRVIYAAIALVSLIAAIHGAKKTGTFIYNLVLAGITIFGIKTAYHHVWLQSLPPSEWPASCGMPLNILYKQVPLTGFLHTILSGSAECAMASWKIFGISGAMISLWGFSLITLLLGYSIIKLLLKQG